MPVQPQPQPQPHQPQSQQLILESFARARYRPPATKTQTQTQTGSGSGPQPPPRASDGGDGGGVIEQMYADRRDAMSPEERRRITARMHTGARQRRFAINSLDGAVDAARGDDGRFVHDRA